MSVLDLLKKGFGYLLMSFGVSSPRNSSQVKKPVARPKSGIAETKDK